VTGVLQVLFDALSLGSLYALGALGIALIFGVMRLVNFAHGDYIAFSVFLLLWPTTEAMSVLLLGTLPTPLLILAVIAVGALLSVLSEIVVFRRLRNASPASMMIASFALGFVLKHVLLMFYSSRPKSVSILPGLAQQVEIMGARIPLLQVVTIGATIVILIALTAFLKRTRFGLEMRAAAQDFTMARMLGVKANRVILLAFAISGALAGAIGLVLVVQSGTTDINMGLSVMLVAFIATVIGGLGSLYGAVVAGFLIGGASVLMQVLLPLDARPFRDAFVYALVIAVLIWRPQGLFAPRSARQRV
jgi:branched-chain amino acid transport system permease protein